jgi:hypothetical protein
VTKSRLLLVAIMNGKNPVAELFDELRTVGQEMIFATEADRSRLFYGKAKPLLLKVKDAIDSRFKPHSHAHEKLASAHDKLASLAELEETSFDPEEYSQWLHDDTKAIEWDIILFDRERSKMTHDPFPGNVTHTYEIGSQRGPVYEDAINMAHSEKNAT